ncbi:MAG: hypothetical protein AAF467_08200 [Actinomycetota bacterium]
MTFSMVVSSAAVFAIAMLGAVATGAAVVDGDVASTIGWFGLSIVLGVCAVAYNRWARLVAAQRRALRRR